MDFETIIKYQQGIIDDNTDSGLFMFFNINNESFLQFGLKILQKFVDGKHIVAGFSNNLMNYFPSIKYKSEVLPNLKNKDNYDLVLWLKNNDNGVIFHQAYDLKKALFDFFSLEKTIKTFSYHKKYDLSGFEYGIKSFNEQQAEDIAIIKNNENAKLDGSSFWVLQQWKHDFNWLNNNSQAEKESCIGRSLDNSKIIDNFTKHTHINKMKLENQNKNMLRKYIAWSNDNLDGGLMFSGFSTSFEIFNLQIQKMLNKDSLDGVLNFSKILHTNYLWCPPFKTGKLDLSLFKMI